MSEVETRKTDDAADFVTVAEAARRLSLSERQARRYAARLGDGDRRAGHGPDTTPDNMTGAGRTQAGRSPALVRLSALAKAAGKDADAGHEPDNTPDMGRTHDRPTPDALGVEAGHGPDTSETALSLRAALDAQADAEKRAAVAEAVVAEVKGERDRLATALSEAQATARAALDALREEQSRASVLIAAAAQGRLIGPGQEAKSDSPDPSQNRYPMRTSEVAEPYAETGENVGQSAVENVIVHDSLKNAGVHDRSPQLRGQDVVPETPAVTTSGPESGPDAPAGGNTPPGFWARLFGAKGKAAN